jgi:hypothetical protein
MRLLRREKKGAISPGVLRLTGLFTLDSIE